MRLPARIGFGTMHDKAVAVAPPLARLGIELVVPEAFDTDRFGTFTGEVARAGDMLAAARAKAKAAAEATGLSVALASEGAYGPHPAVPFMPFGRELLLWLEPASGREIVEWLADETPAFDQLVLAEASGAETFVRRIGFPETSVIVAPAGVPGAPVAKGVSDLETLFRAVAAACTLSPERRALVQTDMRAHCNPRRMQAIGRLAHRLAERLAVACPACDAPGWGLMRTVPGLPCTWCGSPTPLSKEEVYGCTACGHEAATPPSHGHADADPSLCPFCNP